MPGTRGKLIVYITHFLVVERSYSDIPYVEVSFAANLINKIILAIHPVFYIFQ